MAVWNPINCAQLTHIRKNFPINITSSNILQSIDSLRIVYIWFNEDRFNFSIIEVKVYSICRSSMVTTQKCITHNIE